METTSAAAIAMLEFVTVTMPSMTNICRSVARSSPPSAMAIAPAMQTMVKAPVASVATYRAIQVGGSSVSPGTASACTIMTATHATNASCARLKISLTGASLRKA